MLITSIPTEMLKGFIDAGLDKIEEMVDESETQWDDLIIEPLIDKIREVVNVPDGDD